MTATRQPEGSSRTTEEHFTATLFQVEQQSQDSSNSSQEHPETTPLTPSAAGKDSSAWTFHLKPQGSTLTTIAVELRFKIYEHLFQSSARYLLRRRDGIDDENVIKRLAHTFNCSILFTCRKLYEEAHPFFYATQTFHHSFNTGGLSVIRVAGNDLDERQGAMPHFSNNLHLMKNLSLCPEFHYRENIDAALSRQIAEFTQHCPQLRVLTIHLVGGDLADSAPGNQLRRLLPRLDNLNIIGLGYGPQDVTPGLRLSIAADRYWSVVCMSDRPDRYKESQWPYLTLPFVIQDRVHRSCSFPILEADIYKWTCSLK